MTEKSTIDQDERNQSASAVAVALPPNNATTQPLTQGGVSPEVGAPVEDFGGTPLSPKYLVPRIVDCGGCGCEQDADIPKCLICGAVLPEFDEIGWRIECERAESAALAAAVPLAETRAGGWVSGAVDDIPGPERKLRGKAERRRQVAARDPLKVVAGPDEETARAIREAVAGSALADPEKKITAPAIDRTTPKQVRRGRPPGSVNMREALPGESGVPVEKQEKQEKQEKGESGAGRFTANGSGTGTLDGMTGIEIVDEFYRPIRGRSDVKFREAAQPWQREHIVGPMFDPKIEELYAEAVRDADKTGLTAACIIGLCLTQPNHLWRFYAVDKDQSAVAKLAAMERFVLPSPVLKSYMDVQTSRIVFRNGNVMLFEAADAPSAWGKPGNVACDESHAWIGKKHEALWETIISKQTDKRAIVTTPGIKDTFPWTIREGARMSALLDPVHKHFFTMLGQVRECVPWKSDKYLQEQELKLTALSFQRLHMCEWTVGVGDFITLEDYEQCESAELRYRESGFTRGSIGALDFGLKNDRTVLSVVRMQGGTVHIDYKRVWQGTRREPVDVDEVEAEMVRLHKEGVDRFVVDPWNTGQLTQHLIKLGIIVEEFTASQQSVSKLSKNLYYMFRNKKIAVPKIDDDFKREVLALVAIETPFGFRIDHMSGKHDDQAMSVGMGALIAMQEPEYSPISCDQLMSEMVGAGVRSGGGYEDRYGALATADGYRTRSGEPWEDN